MSTGYFVIQSKSKGKGAGEYWLIWRFEGEDTLAGLIQSKEFPYNVSIDTNLVVYSLLKTYRLWQQEAQSQIISVLYVCQ